MSTGRALPVRQERRPSQASAARAVGPRWPATMNTSSGPWAHGQCLYGLNIATCQSRRTRGEVVNTPAATAA